VDGGLVLCLDILYISKMDANLKGETSAEERPQVVLRRLDTGFFPIASSDMVSSHVSP